MAAVGQDIGAGAGDQAHQLLGEVERRHGIVAGADGRRRRVTFCNCSRRSWATMAAMRDSTISGMGMVSAALASAAARSASWSRTHDGMLSASALLLR